MLELFGSLRPELGFGISSRGQRSALCRTAASLPSPRVSAPAPNAEIHSLLHQRAVHLWDFTLLSPPEQGRTLPSDAGTPQCLRFDPHADIQARSQSQAAACTIRGLMRVQIPAQATTSRGVCSETRPWDSEPHPKKELSDMGKPLLLQPLEARRILSDELRWGNHSQPPHKPRSGCGKQALATPGTQLGDKGPFRAGTRGTGLPMELPGAADGARQGNEQSPAVPEGGRSPAQLESRRGTSGGRGGGSNGARGMGGTWRPGAGAGNEHGAGGGWGGAVSVHTHTSACRNNKAGGEGAAPTPRQPAGDLRAGPTPTAARWHVWALGALHGCSRPHDRPEQVPELTARS